MKRLMICTTALAIFAPLAGGASAQEAGALGEGSLRPMDITCADIMGASEGERPGLVFFLAGYRAAMDQQGAMGASAEAGAAAVTTEEPDPAAVGAADATNQPAEGAAPAAETAPETAGAEVAGVEPDAEATTEAAAETTTVDSAGDEVGGVTDVMLARSFLGTGVSEILAGCEGNDTMAAINVIGTAAGWPEPSLDTQPGTPEGNQ
jgi:hypothetical protein